MSTGKRFVLTQISEDDLFSQTRHFDEDQSPFSRAPPTRIRNKTLPNDFKLPPTPPKPIVSQPQQTNDVKISIQKEDDVFHTPQISNSLLISELLKPFDEYTLYAYPLLLRASPYKTVGDLLLNFTPQSCKALLMNPNILLDGTSEQKRRALVHYIKEIGTFYNQFIHEEKDEKDEKEEKGALQVEGLPQTFVALFEGVNHLRPEAETEYFLKEGKEELRSMDVSVVVPFFNESRDELEKTLLSLYHQQKDLLAFGGELKVLLVSDGWKNCHPTTKNYLQEIFPGNWCERLDLEKQKEVNQTIVIQCATKKGLNHKLEPLFIDTNGKSLYISILIKTTNCKKHNSHEWFLKAFLPTYNSEFMFLTDCGTTFNKHCFFHLLKELLLHPTWTAVSGKPRLLTNSDCLGFTERIIQAAQVFDFEATTASFTSAFSLSGMLPVIPGPCGMYRYEEMKEKAIPFYVETLNKGPQNAGLLLSLLLLAEDRVLSYGAVLKAKGENACTALVPEAEFFFEAEINQEKLLPQRRRWINGTIAGYLWLLQNMHLIFEAKIPTLKKTLIVGLTITQILMYLVVVFSPAFTATLLYFSISGYVFQNDRDSEYKPLFPLGYMALYGLYVLSHSWTNRKLIGFLHASITKINVLIMFWILIWFCLEVWQNGISFTIGLVLLSFALPFALAILSSVGGFLRMVQSFIPFLLYLPTFTAFFGAYSFSKLADLSWGNRPATEEAQQISSLKSKGRFICFMIVLCNFAFAAIMVLKLQHNSEAVIYLTGGIFAFVFIQLALSFVFVLGHNLYQMSQSVSMCCWLNCKKKTKAEFYLQNQSK